MPLRTLSSPPSASTLRLCAAAGLMLAAIAALHFVCLHFYPKDQLDIYRISDFYPLSVFNFRTPKLWQAGLGLVYATLFFAAWPRLSKLESLPQVFCLGLLFAFLSNSLHGWRYGIDYPTATWGDSGIEYYHDAILVQGPRWFLARFNTIQFELLEHSRTHPPGPVLLYYALFHLLNDPGLISIAIAAISLALALPAWKRLLQLAFGQVPEGALLLYAVLPAVLIYGLAVVDAVIAGLFLQAVACFVDDQRRDTWFGATLFVALSAFFTFGCLFLLPVLAGYELLVKRRLTRSALVLVLAALLLAALKPLTGFDWLAAFLKASAMENEKGFLFFADRRRYVWYRLGAVAEIAFFFTPFLIALAWQGRRALKAQAPAFFTLAWLGPVTLAAMLLSGAMKIGEAARICIFILPYLLLPAIAAWQGLDAKSRQRSAGAVVIWGLAMQLGGFFQW